ncbi:hypothetical protein Amir_3905 [Actinosynnema mirum DSM 43827]|uniref:Uncharacterized protein n=1 Tax=Actinosynnema mirum (strain ATCC 29888 / DSM 43827 / JCM 3225 / NBRC 14064 / NCIMB 13271 / NRRL B-12336 / IMRU 3971 / 101) TaxID=446462 RepID=C6WEH9_ACTMD|nr:hypothetical protein Amir_3905 [Actinosynnema mirum DSM 43827]
MTIDPGEAVKTLLHDLAEKFGRTPAPTWFDHTVDLVVIPFAEPARIAEADWDVEGYGDVHHIEDHAVLREEEASLTAGRATDLPALVARAREGIRARGPHLRRHNWAELILDAETGANAFVLPVAGDNVTGHEILDEDDTLLCLVLTTTG